jgi:hypothetical protein
MTMRAAYSMCKTRLGAPISNFEEACTIRGRIATTPAANAMPTTKIEMPICLEDGILISIEDSTGRREVPPYEHAMANRDYRDVTPRSER